MMPDCRYEELIPMFSAQYSGDHVWRWNAMESPGRVHSSQLVKDVEQTILCGVT